MAKLPNIRFRIDFAENSNIGPGKVALLEAIKAAGSVSEAARVLGFSYRRAWLLLDSLNKSFDTPVTVNSVGGRGGGGARVTAFGTLLIERFRELEGEINLTGKTVLKDVLRRVAAQPKVVPPLKRASLAKRGRAR